MPVDFIKKVDETSIWQSMRNESCMPVLARRALTT